MSFNELITIRQEAREIAAEEAAKPPVECPHDGQQLVYHAGKGLWHCPFDGYVTRRREV